MQRWGVMEVVTGRWRQFPDSGVYGQYARFSSQIHTHTTRDITREGVDTNFSNVQACKHGIWY